MRFLDGLRTNLLRVASVRTIAALVVVAGFVPHAGAQNEMTCLGEPVTIIGTSDGDLLKGTTGRDVIHGLEGDDIVRAGGDDDVICGGDGEDVLAGGPGNDSMEGGFGNDELKGGPGNDRLVGGPGKDVLSGGPGVNELVQEGVLAALIDSNDRGGIRAWAAERSIAAINAEVADLDEARRSRLAEVVLDTDAAADIRDRLLRAMRVVLAHPDLGFYAEVWSYTFIEFIEGGFFGTCGHLFLSPSAFSGLSEVDARNVLMHESFHSFNCVNGGPVGSLDEGASIWIFKAAFPEALHPAETWSEATYGTKLFYRDILGQPDLNLGSPQQPTSKLLEIYGWLSDRDPSRLPWNSDQRLVSCFEKYWEHLNRNVDFFQVWLPAAFEATQEMLADEECRPV
jgi:hypothetical protein